MTGLAFAYWLTGVPMMNTCPCHPGSAPARPGGSGRVLPPCCYWRRSPSCQNHAGSGGFPLCRGRPGISRPHRPDVRESSRLYLTPPIESQYPFAATATFGCAFRVSAASSSTAASWGRISALLKSKCTPRRTIFSAGADGCSGYSVKTMGGGGGSGGRSYSPVRARDSSKLVVNLAVGAGVATRATRSHTIAQSCTRTHGGTVGLVAMLARSFAFRSSLRIGGARARAGDWSSSSAASHPIRHKTRTRGYRQRRARD